LTIPWTSLIRNKMSELKCSMVGEIFSEMMDKDFLESDFINYIFIVLLNPNFTIITQCIYQFLNFKNIILNVAEILSKMVSKIHFHSDPLHELSEALQWYTQTKVELF